MACSAKDPKAVNSEKEPKDDGAFQVESKRGAPNN